MKNILKKIKSKIIVIRNCLDRNKIFIEFIAASSLTIMGIVVSIKANKIAENQTKIMELENTPKLEIRKTQLLNDSTKIYDVSKWLIFNHNSKISNFEIVNEISFLNLIKRDSYEERNIPLGNHLNLGGTLTGESEGLIYEFDNKYTGYNEFLTRQKIWDFGYIQIISYIEITYDNVLEKKENKYYQIDPQIKEINKNYWDSIKNDWINNSNKMINIQKNIDENIKNIKSYN